MESNQPWLEIMIGYLEKGYPVIPLIGKVPKIKGWTKFCSSLPDKPTAVKKQTGIGLCLGPASRLMAIDIDSEDEEIHQIVPVSPLTKRGRIGETRFFQYSAEIASRSLAKVDILSDGRQTVLPPSIHPDTGQSYFWIGTPLLDIHYDEIPTLNPYVVERLLAREKAALPGESRPTKAVRTVSVTAGGGRNNCLKSQVVAGICKGKSLKVIAEEVFQYDIKNHTPPLFQDETEGYSAANEVVARKNAYKFVASISKSFSLNSLAPYTSGNSSSKVFPIPLPPRVPACIDVDVERIPKALRRFVETTALSMGTDMAAVISPLLVALGAAIGSKVRIFPKRNADYFIVPNVWGCICGSAGSRKSPIMDKAFEPLRQIDQRLRKKFKADLKEWGSLSKEKRHLQEMPKQRNLVLNDATPEKIIEMLQAGQCLLELDELPLIFDRCSTSGRESLRSLLKTGWNGYKSISTHTVGGGERYAQTGCLSVFGGIQPDIAKDIFRSLFRGSSGDGLEVRFGCIFNIRGNREPKDIALNASDSQHIQDIFDYLFSDSLIKKISSNDRGDYRELRFPKEISGLFSAWDQKRMDRISKIPDGPHHSYLAKLDKLMIGLTGIFSLVREADKANGEEEISILDFKLAEWWTSFFENEFLIFLNGTADPELAAVYQLLEYFEANVFEDGESVRDIHRRQVSGLRQATRVKAGLKTLENFKYLTLVRVGSSTKVYLNKEYFRPPQAAATLTDQGDHS